MITDVRAVLSSITKAKTQKLPTRAPTDGLDAPKVLCPYRGTLPCTKKGASEAGRADDAAITTSSEGNQTVCGVLLHLQKTLKNVHESPATESGSSDEGKGGREELP